MNELSIVHRIANLKPKQKEMVEMFIALLEQSDQTTTAASSASPLKAGFLKGTFTMRDDFDEPLDDFKEYMH